jgi:hypothetical protein
VQDSVGPELHVLSTEANDVESVLHVYAKGLARAVRSANMGAQEEIRICSRVAHAIRTSTVICGFSEVSEAQTRDVSAYTAVPVGVHQTLERASYTVIDSVGKCFDDLVHMPYVDWSLSTCNDILVVQGSMGINAAADQLFAEFSSVISFDGTCGSTKPQTRTQNTHTRHTTRTVSLLDCIVRHAHFSLLPTDVHSSHLSVIVDTMCKDGHIKPLNRFGVNREHANPLARATYEETPDILCEAAMLGEESKTRGVSACIVLGQAADVGTGVVRVHYHPSMLPLHMQADTKRDQCTLTTSIGPTNVDITDMSSLQYKVDLSDRRYDIRNDSAVVVSRKRMRSPPPLCA